MKIIYKGETKKAPQLKDYDELIAYIANIFGIDEEETDFDSMSLYYMDADGDLISVSCQSDLNETLTNSSFRTKFVFTNDDHDAREQLLKGCLAFNDILFQSIKQSNKKDKQAIEPKMNLTFSPLTNFSLFLQNQIKQSMNKTKIDQQKIQLESPLFTPGNQLPKIDQSFQEQSFVIPEFVKVEYAQAELEPCMVKTPLIIVDQKVAEPEPIVLSAYCVEKKVYDFSDVGGSEFIVMMRFMNDSANEWPSNFIIKKTGGDDVEFKMLMPINYGEEIEEGQTVTVPVQITVPTAPGDTILKLRLGYAGANSEFGDEVTFMINSYVSAVYSLNKTVIDGPVDRMLIDSVCSSDGKTIIMQDYKEFQQQSIIVVDDASLSDQSWETTSICSVQSQKMVFEVEYLSQMKELKKIEEANREIEQIAKDYELRQQIRKRIQIELDRESDDEEEEEEQTMQVDAKSMDNASEELIEDVSPTSNVEVVNVQEIDLYLLQLEAKQNQIRQKREQFEAELAIEEPLIFSKEVLIEQQADEAHDCISAHEEEDWSDDFEPCQEDQSLKQDTNTFLTSLDCNQYNDENKLEDSFDENMNSKYEYDDNNFSESEQVSSDSSIDYNSEGEVFQYKDEKINTMISDYFYNAPKNTKGFMDLDVGSVPARFIR